MIVRYMILSCIICCCFATKIEGPKLKDFKKFKLKYGIKYSSHDEEIKRFKVWKSNFKFVVWHNLKASKGLVNYTLELNEFSDMTHREYVRGFLGYANKMRRRKFARSEATRIFRPIEGLNISTTIDYRDLGYVTPVKNQGRCGSCWAFSATGALEALNFKLTKQLVALSEQNLVECSVSYGNFGCAGGLPEQAFDYVSVNQGIQSESSYPYNDTISQLMQSCKYNGNNTNDTYLTNLDHPISILSGSEVALTQAVHLQGPISVAIDAGKRTFQFYKKGIYYDPDCDREELNHAVLLVGYDADSYIVKNSWGQKWGDKGYIRMARNGKNGCGIATAATYPVTASVS